MMEEKAEQDSFTLKQYVFENKDGLPNYDRNAVILGGPLSAFSGIHRTGDLGVRYFRDSLCRSRPINPNPFLKLPPSSPLMTSGMFGSPRTDFAPDLPIAPAFAQIFQRRRRRESRPRRQRTTFTSEQTLKLELEYNRADYITRPRRFELAEMLNLSESQIKIWFQNRRAKDKRIEKAHVDQQLRTMGYPPMTGTLPLPVSYTSMRSHHSVPSLAFPGSQVFCNRPPSPSLKVTISNF